MITKETLDENIEELPDITVPKVFGLHSNAEISYYEIYAGDIWKNLIQMQSSAGDGGGGGGRDEYIMDVARGIL